MKRFLLAMVFALMPIVAMAQDFQEGRAAYHAGEYETAIKVLRPLAEQGDARAQLWLGMMYSLGNRVPVNDTEAVYWYRQAAQQGNAQAHFNLGWRYFHGQGVVQDYLAAHMWLNIASKNGWGASATKTRKKIHEQLTTRQLAEARRRALVCITSDYKVCD